MSISLVLNKPMPLNVYGEEPTRLAPSAAVARQLWLSSGNRCAYSACDEVIMDSDGTLLGEVAHLRSPKADGPRYDPTYSNNDCRSFDNLVLLCRKHHTIIDQQIGTYTVERLVTMKAEHEKIYTGAADQLRRLVGDVTAGDAPRPALNGGKIFGDIASDELSEALPLINTLCEGLQQVPIDARSALALLVEVSSSGTELPLRILMARADDPDAVVDHLKVLEHYGLVYLDIPDGDSYYEPRCTFSQRYLEGGSMLKELSATAGKGVVRQAIVELDFTVFDQA